LGHSSNIFNYTDGKSVPPSCFHYSKEMFPSHKNLPSMDETKKNMQPVELFVSRFWFKKETYAPEQKNCLC
jgi:hypothetical protein